MSLPSVNILYLTESRSHHDATPTTPNQCSYQLSTYDTLRFQRYCPDKILKVKVTAARSKVKLEDRLQNKAIVFAWQNQSIPKRRNNGSFILRVKNFVEIALFSTVFEIQAFLKKIRKFKMAAIFASEMFIET